jgi:hypothetical protein
MCRALANNDPDPVCTRKPVQCLRQPCADQKAVCDQGQCAAAPAGPQWALACAPRIVCTGWTGKSGVALCTMEKAGAPCSPVGATCDPKDPCNRLLNCQQSAPICPP